jgi:hypothetical protein
MEEVTEMSILLNVMHNLFQIIVKDFCSYKND